MQSAGTNEREAQGVTVGRPEPEETEETAAEEPAQAEEEEAEGEGEVSLNPQHAVPDMLQSHSLLKHSLSSSSRVHCTMTSNCR